MAQTSCVDAALRWEQAVRTEAAHLIRTFILPEGRATMPATNDSPSADLTWFNDEPIQIAFFNLSEVSTIIDPRPLPIQP